MKTKTSLKIAMPLLDDDNPSSKKYSFLSSFLSAEKNESPEQLRVKYFIDQMISVMAWMCWCSNNKIELSGWEKLNYENYDKILKQMNYLY